MCYAHARVHSHVFCKSCVPNLHVIPNIGMQPQRVCNSCINDLQLSEHKKVHSAIPCPRLSGPFCLTIAMLFNTLFALGKHCISLDRPSPSPN